MTHKMLLSPFKKADGSICKTVIHNATRELEILVTEPQSDHEDCLLIQLKSIDYNSCFEVAVVNKDDWNRIVTEIGERCKQMVMEYHISKVKEHNFVFH